MSDKDEFEKFILYGIDGSISKYDCIEMIELIAILSIPLIILGRNNIVTIILSLLPLALYFLVIVKTIKNGKIQGELYLLQNGVCATSFSLLFTMGGLWMLSFLFEGKARVIAICSIIICYILAFIFYGYIINRLIKKNAYSTLQKSNITIVGTLFGVMGISFARTFMGKRGNQTAIELICICCFFLAVLSMMGTFNIYKFCYIHNHREILDESSKVVPDWKVKGESEDKKISKKEKLQIVKILAIGVIVGILLVAFLRGLKNEDPYSNLSYIHESAGNIRDEHYTFEGLEALPEYYSEERRVIIDEMSIRAVAEAAVYAWKQCDNKRIQAFKVPVTNNYENIKIIDADMSNFSNAFETLLATDSVPLTSEKYKDVEYIAVEINESTGAATVNVVNKEYSCIYTYKSEIILGAYYLESAYWIKMIQSGKY